MTWFADLAPLTYLDPEPGTLRAVGWLDGQHPYTKGPVSTEDFDRLFTLLDDPWEPAAFCGFHECELCRFSPGPDSVRFQTSAVKVGRANLYVPAGDVLFVAPSLIVHYIDAHDYQPPAVFWEAVRACPAMRSLEYEEALLAAGGRTLLRRAETEGPPPRQWPARPSNLRRPPGAAASTPSTWRVMRMDHNGKQVEVVRYSTEREARKAVRRLKATAPKLTYWVDVRAD